MDVLLEARRLKKYYPIKKSFRQLLQRDPQQFVKAIDDVSFKVERGKVLVLAGESGSGKTTVARLIMGAEKPDGGSVILEGTEMNKNSKSELEYFRTSVQMIYQDPYSSLDPRLRIIDAVMEPLEIHEKESSKEQKKEKVFKALEDVSLEPVAQIAEKFPHTLSGGQRQRVAMARALVIRPKLILADEPVSMLDVSVRGGILELMRNLKERFRISFVYITHDLSTARYIGDDLAIMYAGKIVESGPIDGVVLNPLHPYTQALIDAIPDPDRDSANSEKLPKIKQEAKGEHSTSDSYFSLSGCRFYDRCPYSMEICKNEPELLRVGDGNHHVSCFLHHHSNQQKE